MAEGLRLLDVPYYQQTRAATCGPACLMMVKKYWDASFELSPQVEFRLWLRSFSLAFFGGTLPAGLAATAADLGLRTQILQQAPLASYYPRAPGASLVESVITSRARRRGIPFISGTNVLQATANALAQGIPPIILVNLRPLIGYHVFHWVVGTGTADGCMYVNDPDVISGVPQAAMKNRAIPLDVLRHMVATDSGRHLRLPPTVVLASPNGEPPVL